MRLTMGLPGEFRQDDSLTQDVKKEHNLGQQAGKWVKALYPPEALADIKKLDNEARTYHDAITLPFDKGIGILPAALIMEHAERMRTFMGRREALVNARFMADPQKWIDWAHTNHNGTFDPSLYPGCYKDEATGTWMVDADKFRKEMKAKFYFRTEPLPVPDSKHFETSVKDLLGLDSESVNIRIEDAAKEAQQELLRRMLKPVAHMAATLKKEDPRIFDSLIGNVKEIADIAPKQNLTDDPVINELAKEMAGLVQYTPDNLRKSAGTREAAAMKAQALMDRLSGYKL
jgi:hypothetical protein